ncbi:hypothetical protein MAQ5080_00484 [Marinomonas aquimarina]|uniref:Cysteine-rich CWC n=1 Tax=Marinomonas aquimarina TaxID=295068 RepID=A0A1A8T5P1_9GAMM|nr:cysteine-rich CWC family protein [Marinomonas aquimarina]SBS26313.1 hypothetical protein MAQ5080_00484 [Marinomonas aquimarina]
MSSIDPNRCPLCGADNHCAVTLKQDPSTCWCHQPDVLIDSDLLAKLPTAARGKACICQHCVTQDAQQKQATGQIKPQPVKLSSDRHMDSFFDAGNS